MASAKSTNASINKRANSLKSRDYFLFISVVQNGCEQIQASLPLTGFFKKKISLGRLSSNVLCVPFGSLPDSVNLFTLRRGRVVVLLDPRMEGFVNNTVRYAGVDEFITPRGSLMNLASVLEPLEVQLPAGSRGVLKFAQLEILFRVDKRPPRFQIPKIITGAGTAPFALPESSVSLEKIAPAIAFSLVAILGFSMLFWLLNAPKVPVSKIETLPFAYAREFIHPNHYRILPFVFRERVDTELPTSLALEWVHELQTRWAAARKGGSHVSRIQALSNFPATSLNLPDIAASERRARKAYQEFYHARNLQRDNAYLQALTAFPRVMTEVSGGPRGSFYVQVARNIRMMNATFKAKWRASKNFCWTISPRKE